MDAECHIRFRIGDTVQVGYGGPRGKITNIVHPLGTFPLYTVHLFTGGFLNVARHELVKGECPTPRPALAAADPSPLTADLFEDDPYFEQLTEDELLAELLIPHDEPEKKTKQKNVEAVLSIKSLPLHYN